MRKTPVLTLRREDGRVVAESVTVADSTTRRLRGLLGKSELPPGQGILLRPAWSIHTAFMRFPIDVVFLDPDQVVIRIDPALKPFSTASCRGAREVVELAAGECERRGLGLGDRVAWAARSQSLDDTGDGALIAGHDPAPPTGTAFVVSSDPRFTKLFRFLLESREISVAVSAPESATSDIEEHDVAVVVIDAERDVASGLRLANALRVVSSAPVLLAREGADTAVPGGTTAFHKWDETELLVAEIERLVGAEHPPDEG